MSREPRFRADAGNAVAVATGLFLGIGAGLAIAHGAFVPAALGVLGLAGLVFAAGRLGREARRPLMAVVAIAVSVRVALAAVLHYALLAQGRPYGYLFGDDWGYPELAERFVRTFGGETGLVSLQVDGYLFGNYVYLQVAQFVAFGVEALLPKILNGLLLVASGLVMFDLIRTRFSTATALRVSAFYMLFPSIVLWSVLNLKDALALFLVIAVAWATLRTVDGRGRAHLALAFLSLALLASVRTYLFYLLALLIPVAIFFALRDPLRVRLRWTAVTAAASAALLALSFTGLLGFRFFSNMTPEAIAGQPSRAAVGARTAFAEEHPPFIVLQAGQVFAVATPSLPPGSVASPAASATPSGATPTPSPRVVYVAPGTALIVGTPPPDPASNVVYVQPRDVVVVVACLPTTPGPGSPAPASPVCAAVPSVDPAFASQLNPLVLPTGRPTDVEVSGADDANLARRSLIRLIANVPRGLVHALFAPYPWEARDARDVIAALENLIWYPLLALAVVGGWIERRNWYVWVLPVGYVAGALFVYAAIEGNVGTAFRHRAMVVPFTLLLFAATVEHILRRRA